MFITRATPVLKVRDLDEAMSFYRDRLGFDIAWIWGEPLGRAGVSRDGLELQIVSDGMRDFRIVDPSENRLGFGEPIEP